MTAENIALPLELKQYVSPTLIVLGSIGIAIFTRWNTKRDVYKNYVITQLLDPNAIKPLKKLIKKLKSHYLAQSSDYTSLWLEITNLESDISVISRLPKGKVLQDSLNQLLLNLEDAVSQFRNTIDLKPNITLSEKEHRLEVQRHIANQALSHLLYITANYQEKFNKFKMDSSLKIDTSSYFTPKEIIIDLQ